jgi:hypothetical protein
MTTTQKNQQMDTSIVATGTNTSSSAQSFAIASDPSNAIPLDRYGFHLDDDYRGGPLKLSHEIVEARKKKETERSMKWAKMIKNWDLVLATRQEKLKRRVRKGIPDAVRGLAWFRMSGAVRFKKMYPDLRKLDVASLPALTLDDVSLLVGRVSWCVSRQFHVMSCRAGV